MAIKAFKIIILYVLFCFFNLIYAGNGLTKRIPEFSNTNVNVWKTIIYPTSAANLSMHRHDYPRVLVALTDGVVKVTNNQGKIHYLTLKKGHSYYLQKDPENELHMDENMTKHPITVVVVELKN